MIRYSSNVMEEISCLFSRLGSRGEDAVGLLKALVSEMMNDEAFMTLFPGNEICEELSYMASRAQILSEQILRLSTLHKNLTAEYRDLEEKYLRRCRSLPHFDRRKARSKR